MAERHDATNPPAAVERSSGEYGTLPTVSGDECAEVLARVGYRREREFGHAVWMQRESHLIILSKRENLRRELLVGVLKEAGISPAQFSALLERRPSSGMRAALPKGGGR